MESIPTKLPPLAITCTSSDCEQNLHCFRKTKKLIKLNLAGACRSCGAQLIDWPRVHQLSLDDIDYTFESLKKELIRHHFWHKKIDQHAINYALRKGRLGMKSAIRHRLDQALAPAEPAFDGRQTPPTGNPIYYAQHATASCCRKCAEEWHGIPLGRELTDQEVAYLTDLAYRYVVERIPEMTDAGQKVPPIRNHLA